MPRIRCECGNEILVTRRSPAVIQCNLCHRRPSQGVLLVAHDIGRFSALLIVLSFITAAPAIWVFGEALTRPQTDAGDAGVPVWAYLTIFVSLVQIGYSVYLLQFPHWASLQAVALVSLMTGVAAAIAFGGTLVGSSSGWAGTVLQLGELLPQVRGPRITSASMWCLLVTAAWTGLAIWAGWRASTARAQAVKSAR